MHLFELEFFPLKNCDYEPNVLTGYLILTRFFGLIYSLFFFFIGVGYHELYFLSQSIGLIINHLLNTLLKILLLSPVPNGTCGSSVLLCDDPLAPETRCHGSFLHLDASSTHPDTHRCVPCSAPTLGTQQTAFLMVAVYAYLFQFYPRRYRTFYSFSLGIWFGIMVYASVFFGFSRPTDDFVASLAGSLFSGVYQLLLYMFGIPLFPSLVNWRVFVWFGPYRDTFTTSVPIVADAHVQRQVEQLKQQSSLVSFWRTYISPPRP